jgi:hypothetical protein
MDKLGKVAQEIGIPVEQLSALKYAAGLADVSFESLSDGAIKLAKNMSLVAGGAKGPASEAFKALGVSVTDSNGNLKDTSAVLGRLRTSPLYDSAAKTALATTILARGGRAGSRCSTRARDQSQPTRLRGSA